MGESSIPSEPELQDGDAKTFFTSFLMCLDIGSMTYKNHPYFTTWKEGSLDEIAPPEEELLQEERECKFPENYREGVEPYKLEEEWEYLDEITPKEEEIIHNTWRQVRRDLRTNGHLIFIRFLKDYPHYKQHMSKMLEDNTELEKNQKLSDLGYSVMNLLDRIAANLSRPKICTRLLFSEGFKYAKHKLNIKHFLDFQTSMLSVLKDILKQRFTPEVEITWKKFLTIIMGIMEDASHWNDLGYR